jgi:tRNA A-37 threonylcarbamoyl transferase component Bud32
MSPSQAKAGDNFIKVMKGGTIHLKRISGTNTRDLLKKTAVRLDIRSPSGSFAPQSVPDAPIRLETEPEPQIVRLEPKESSNTSKQELFRCKTAVRQRVSISGLISPSSFNKVSLPQNHRRMLSATGDQQHMTSSARSLDRVPMNAVTRRKPSETGIVMPRDVNGESKSGTKLVQICLRDKGEAASNRSVDVSIHVRRFSSLSKQTPDYTTNVSRAVADFSNILSESEERLDTQDSLVEGTPKTIPQNAQITEFDLGRLLGRGAFATVREATHRNTRLKVAIKQYSLKTASKVVAKNIKQEISTLTCLNHPNIVKLLLHNETLTNANLIMEYVEGEQLSKLLQRQPNGKLSEEYARCIFGQLVSAVDYCHALHIVHRDIKTENIMITSGNVVKLIDFGFSTISPPLEKLQLYCGTPVYLAPEILKKKEYIGSKVDVWALGIVLFNLVTGHFPFIGNSHSELNLKISKGEWSIPSYLSLELVGLLRKLLAIDPESRVPASQVDTPVTLDLAIVDTT